MQQMQVHSPSASALRLGIILTVAVMTVAASQTIGILSPEKAFGQLQNSGSTTAGPNINLSPASLLFSATAGGSNPASQTVTVTSTGVGTLSWSVTDDVSWLSSAASGSTLTATVDTSGLAAGTYNGTISVTDANASNSPQTIPVTLTVDPATSAGFFNAIQSALVRIGLLSGPVQNQQIAQPQTSQTTSTGTLAGSLTGAPSNRGNGSTVCRAPENTTGSTMPRKLTESVEVRQIKSRPFFTLSPGSLAFTGTQGSTKPIGQTVTISLLEGAEMSWNTSNTKPWLSTNASGCALTALIDIAGLSPGTHTASITVRGSRASNSPQVVPVTLTVNPGSSPPPAIGLNSTSLAFAAIQGGTNPANQTVTVSNTGGGTLNWAAADNAAWLTATKSGSTLTAGVDITGLTAGSYTGTITVTDPNATNSPQTISVTLTVAVPPPAIALSPTSLTFMATVGGNAPASQSVAVSNTGGGTLNWAVSDNGPWLNTTKSGSSITATANIGSLAAGTYNAIITVMDPNASNSPQTIPVTLILSSSPVPPAIGFSPTTLAFSATEGGTNPAAQSVTVSNTGGGTLNWSATDNAAWLTATKSGSSITAGVDITGLTAGSYTGTITVSDPNASNSPQTVPVTLTVASPPPTIALSSNSLAFSATEGGADPPTQTITVSNTGGGTLNWSVSDNRAWLTATKSGSSILVDVSLGSRQARTYNGTITVTDSGATNSPQTIAVTFTVNAAPPAIGLSPTGLTFTATEGGVNPADQTITVSNTGGGTLNWSVTDNTAWLTTAKSGSTLTATVDITGLTAGTYNGTITVSDPNATNNPQTASVTLTVNAAPPSATLSWDANTESDLAGYKIYRSTTPGVYGAPIATVSVGTETYQDTAVSPNTTYNWVVTAVDNAGNESGVSNEVSKSIF